MAPVAIDHPVGGMDPCDALAQLKAARNNVIHAPHQASATSSGPRAHTGLTLNTLEDLLASDNGTVLDGHHLATGNVVGAAKSGSRVDISRDPAVVGRVDGSVEYLHSKLHTSIYGVNTGFGGSADTRTDAPSALQISLLEHQLGGVLPTSDALLGTDFATVDPMANAMPEAIVRGAMLIRVNSLVRGHSGVRMEVLQTLVTMLNKHLTPMVPLRGSISASGDLQPLAYVAAAICGHPDIRVFDRSSGRLEIVPAAEALAKHGIKPVSLGPKEGLGLVNGTAFSASAACLAAHDAHILALLTQALTAMTTEAMVGQAGNFHPFIHDVCRPHPGQVESARNMLSLLEGSRLAVEKEETRRVAQEMDQNVLRQDRYPLRTSPQWLGPQIEDLKTVHEALTVEINSTTDNPLLDVEGDHTHHGGNFQATAVAQAMEKTRLALFMFGKLAFSQTTELINCTMNKGLPSCLAGDEPSTNYHVKGLDINMAAYTAELGYLASSVTTHVQSAEQHNQAVNSMALVSARYAIQAVEVLSMLLSAQLYCVCMAVDLRVVDLCFRQRLADSTPSLLSAHFASALDRPAIDKLSVAVLASVYKTLERSASMDSWYRFVEAFNCASAVAVDALSASDKGFEGLKNLAAWKKQAADEAAELYVRTRDEFLDGSAAPSLSYMGKTGALYAFVRQDLDVKPRRGDVKCGGHQGAIGSDVSKIHYAIRSGKLNPVLSRLFSSL